MKKKTGSFKEDFSKNAYYRFLRGSHSNWLRFTTLLSEKIVNEHLRGLTSTDRADCFVVDDSLYERIGYKHTELASKVFDHVSMKFKKGFRMMTLGWTDGCSFIPINFSLLASSKEEISCKIKCEFTNRKKYKQRIGTVKRSEHYIPIFFI
ncbi:MAG: transposase [Negativicoccus succinicivorans]|nr:transposase [Negativicoccus succinicivorans]